MVGLMITGISAVVGVLTLIFGHFITKDLRAGLKALRVEQRKVEQDNIDSRADFFREVLSSNGKTGKISVYYNVQPIIKNTMKKASFKDELKRSYLITGESGCGKSTFLRKDYTYHSTSLFSRRFPFFHLIKWLKTCSLYFSSNSLLSLTEDKVKDIEEKCSKLPISHIRLYLDGLDEMGEMYEEKKILIAKLIKAVRIVEKCDIKIACRSNFEKKHSCHNLLDNAHIIDGYDRLEIDYWDSDALEEVSKKVLSNKNLIKTIDNQPSDISKKAKLWMNSFLSQLKGSKHNYFKNAESVDKCLINSPLILMLFLYVNLFTLDEVSLLNDITKYELYEMFINSLGQSNSGPISSVEAEKELIANLVFDNYSMLLNDSKNVHLRSSVSGGLTGINYLNRLIKNPEDQNREISFIHFSFYDFFVSYYYKTTIEKCNDNLDDFINVLGAEYSNEISDFITESLDKEKDNDQIAQNMCSVYKTIIDNRECGKYSTMECFLAKKEISFRLGRLRYSSLSAREEISAFLKDVYEKDEYTYAGDDDKEVHLAMLKRWIAIAGSLLHTNDGEKIELDYIKKMICKSYTNNIEDLANRSQTLVFYGDVTNSSGLDFRDNNQETECIKSIHKRVNRLCKINDESGYNLLDNELNPRDSKLKYYCFRAFDLSTIYCLLRFHKSTNELFKVELNGLKNPLNISDIRVSFKGANPEREKILIALKEALNKDVLPDRIKLD